MSPKRLKTETSSSDVVKWQVFLEEEQTRAMNDHDSTIWHLAQVAEWVAGVPYRLFGADLPKALSGTDKFLLKFTTKEEFLKNRKKAARRQKKLDQELSFNAFAAFANIDPLTMLPRVGPVKPPPVKPPRPADAVNPLNSSQNGPVPPVFSPERVPTPPAAGNKKTGPKSKNVSIRGKA